MHTSGGANKTKLHVRDGSPCSSCPTTEAVEYLRVEWKKYEMQCRDIKVGTTILMELDPTLVERVMAGVEEQSKEYSKLSSNMGCILTNLTKIQHYNPQQ